MTILTAIEIATNYPNGDILIDAAQHKSSNKWTSFMYLMRYGEMHKLMLSFDINENFPGFNTKEEAIAKMEEIAQTAIKYVTENLNND